MADLTEAAGPLPARRAIAGFDGRLATPNLSLRRAQPVDAEPLFAHFNDWEVVRWLSAPPWPQRFESVAAYLAYCEAAGRAGEVLALAITWREVPVGLVAWERGDASSHFGYWLGRIYWGRGWGSEAATAVCDWIFAASTVDAVDSGVFDGNSASLRIQEKLGFIEVGRSLRYSVSQNAHLPHVDTRLTRTAHRHLMERRTS